MISAVAIAAAVAVPSTFSAAPAVADDALVCFYWTSFTVTPGPPQVNIPLPTGIDTRCTVQTEVVQQISNQVQQVVERIDPL
ncbi:MAG TPA: hypothetical protein VGX28_16145 [Frankiaceae bacterium]|nr:hypothetical protein [Frankiaceae bacterium]